MDWNQFPNFAITILIFWTISLLLFAIPTKNTIIEKIALSFSIGGVVILSFFILFFWIFIERPPLRTLGETRLWYSFFISALGIVTYLRWHNSQNKVLTKIVFRLFILFELMMASVFLLVNLLHPENHDKVLMPALQSPWFVPHVIVYILSYALLGLSSIAAIVGLYLLYKRKFESDILKLSDNLVYIGFAFLSFGLIFGALWAKEAWGHYWTWDPKETWAFLTWIGYLIYIHYRYYHPKHYKSSLWILSMAFIVLLICWFGINYLPSAQNSVHVYSN